ncbi:MAG: hypothetical protein HYY76_17815 [Acidobacteria bacterium]|nr:hypothetical protein [Acidobacteriota bacterium]
MSRGILTRRATSRGLLAVALACLVGLTTVEAQGRGGRGGAPATARARAPIDLTGYWTAVVSEDWHTRMLTAPKGDFGSGAPGAIEIPGVGPIGVGANPSERGNIPYNARGAKAALAWDPAKDEAEGNTCKAYGAPGIMRLPTQLRISWQDDSTLKLEADHGTQTRLFHFGPLAPPGRMDFSNATYVPPPPLEFEPPPGVQPSGQGYSMAVWHVVPATGIVERGGHLKVVTMRLTPGYYWKNGMPYTGSLVLTEYFRLMELPDRSQWIRYTQIAEDPEYLTQPWVVNYAFRKLPDGSRWNPIPCSVK